MTVNKQIKYMNLIEFVKSSFHDSAELKNRVVETLSPAIVAAGELLVQSIRSGGKILSCGNGGSACDAQHFAAEIVGRFQMEREGLPAISLATDIAILTSVANDFGYENVFARQVEALGREEDVLLAISTSGNSPSVMQAINKAHERGMRVIALTGRDGGVMAGILRATDIEIRVSDKVTTRIQEVHGLVIHCLCDLLEKILFEKN